MNKPPDAIIQRIRKGRWTTALVTRGWVVHDIRYWPTKSSANAWLCMTLDKLAVVQTIKPPIGG